MATPQLYDVHQTSSNELWEIGAFVQEKLRGVDPGRIVSISHSACAIGVQIVFTVIIVVTHLAPAAEQIARSQPHATAATASERETPARVQHLMELVRTGQITQAMLDKMVIAGRVSDADWARVRGLIPRAG